MHYIVAGIVQIIIGIILIYRRKSVVALVVKSQKEVDHILSKKGEWNNTKHYFIPILIVVTIGVGLILTGILAIIMVT